MATAQADTHVEIDARALTALPAVMAGLLSPNGFPTAIVRSANTLAPRRPFKFIFADDGSWSEIALDDCIHGRGMVNAVRLMTHTSAEKSATLLRSLLGSAP